MVAMSNGHIVQFFDTDESRTAGVAAFLAEGYAAGEPMFLVARPTSWHPVIGQLEKLGVCMHSAIADGMLVVKDANDSLRRVAPLGTPDMGAFQDTFGATLQGLARRGPRVRMYGEMVDILAERGDFENALKLEAIGNVLVPNFPVHVLCGYAATSFLPTNTHRAMVDICCAHGDVRRHQDDPLAAWLLNAAHNHHGDHANLQH
jgi:hypothetical protein